MVKSSNNLTLRLSLSLLFLLLFVAFFPAHSASINCLVSPSGLPPAGTVVDNGLPTIPCDKHGIPFANQGASSGEYETVAASQTAQVIGATGAIGDFLLRVVCVPATTSPGVANILDNATIVVSFPGGATSVADLKPFTIDVGLYSVSGAWKITTGASMSCVAIGNFT